MSDETKQCPFCAEDIKLAAIVCKHCGRELPGYEQAIENSRTKPLIYSNSNSSFGENYYKLFNIIEDAINQVVKDDHFLQYGYNIITKYSKFESTSKAENQSAEIDAKWYIYHFQDIPTSPIEGKIRFYFDDIEFALQERTDLFNTWDSLKFSLFNKLKLTAFKIGIEMGEVHKREDIFSINPEIWNILESLTTQFSSQLLKIFPEDLLTTEELHSLKLESNKLIFLLFQKIYQLGFEHAQNFSRNDQTRINEIKNIPNSILSFLPISLYISWETSDKFNIKINSKKQLSPKDNTNLLAISAPLVTLDQMISISPPFRKNFKYLLQQCYKSFNQRPAPLDIDPVLKSVEINLFRDNNKIIPTVTPKFKKLSSNYSKEMAIVNFLINYIQATTLRLDQLLKLSVLSSVIFSTKFIPPDVDTYTVLISGRDYWKITPDEEVVKKYLDDIHADINF